MHTQTSCLEFIVVHKVHLALISIHELGCIFYHCLEKVEDGTLGRDCFAGVQHRLFESLLEAKVFDLCIRVNAHRGLQVRSTSVEKSGLLVYQTYRLHKVSFAACNKSLSLKMVTTNKQISK